MTRMYFDVKQVREFLLKNGYVATLRDPRITTERGPVERLDLWVHDGSRWGKPLGLKANRVYIYSVGTSEEIETFAPVSSFASADEWWAKATKFYKPSRTVEINGKNENLWSLDLYYVQLARDLDYEGEALILETLREQVEDKLIGLRERIEFAKEPTPFTEGAFELLEWVLALLPKKEEPKK